ncbi:unnamed protein product [[Candida] boidinii]|nr:unnamed protein product [[Candida] boidinii]
MAAVWLLYGWMTPTSKQKQQKQQKQADTTPPQTKSMPAIQRRENSTLHHVFAAGPPVGCGTQHISICLHFSYNPLENPHPALPSA